MSHTTNTTNASAKRIQEPEPNVLKLEPHMKRHESLRGRPIDEQCVVVVLVDFA